MLQRSGETLGKMIDWQCRAALDASGLHSLIGEDCDGDWGLIWEYLAELRPRAEAAEAKVARVEALAESLETERPSSGAWRGAYRNNARRLRAALVGDGR